LKISKGWSEAVNLRRTSYTMTKKCTNNGMQNITQKTNDLATRNPLKIGGYLRSSGMVSSSYCTCGTRRVTFHMVAAIDK
jgi:hypothetical protein